MTEQAAGTVAIISIVGKSDSGKTTFLERVVRVLTARGWRVATVKHHVHEFDIDVPGKDSWRHAHAGAVMTMVSSPTQFAAIRRVEREYTLAELAEQAAAAGADILVTEGYKSTATARIEVSRRGRSEELISTPDELVALVTDNPAHQLPGVPVFALDDGEGVASLVEREYLAGRRSATGTSADLPPRRREGARDGD